MERPDTLILIGETAVRDENGVFSTTETRREVLCRVGDISAREFFYASRQGLNPRYRFRLFFGDYQGEELAEFHGERYAVYRTFQKGDTMELYCERRGGNRGGAAELG